jgi:acyl-CoA hydrolase
MQATQLATRPAAGQPDDPSPRTAANCPSTARGHETIHRFRVDDTDIGAAGVVDGGTVFEWIYRAAHVTAAQWSGRRCVSASVGNIHLDRPITSGEFAEVHASIVYTGRSSVHVLITMRSTDPNRAVADQTCQCAMVFVAVDDAGNPVEVPVWTPVTMLELQRHRQARVRIRMRKRIETAIAAENYTTEGTAPHLTRSVAAGAGDVNWGNNIHGSRVMRWIDDAARGCAAAWMASSAGDALMSYSAGIRFYRPVTAGEAIDVTARIVHTGPRSIHCGIRVATRGARPGLVADAVVVVVSLDGRVDAVAVPAWTPVSGEDRRLDKHARHLIELRQFIEPFTTAAALPADAEVRTAHPAEPGTTGISVDCARNSRK